MTTPANLYDAVWKAWASVPAPPAEDLQYMAWGWGDDAARAFTGIAPINVDIRSHGFHTATPLLDLPPRAAAAYLGTFLLSLLKGLEFQQKAGIFTDVLSRSHTITCLTLPSFREKVVRPFLPAQCRDVLAKVLIYMAMEMDALSLTQKQVDIMLIFAAQP